MECLFFFGLSFFIMGIYMIVKKNGIKVFSKSNKTVTGKDAVIQGIIALVVGSIFTGLAVLDLLSR